MELGCIVLTRCEPSELEEEVKMCMNDFKKTFEFGICGTVSLSEKNRGMQGI